VVSSVAVVVTQTLTAPALVVVVALDGVQILVKYSIQCIKYHRAKENGQRTSTSRYSAVAFCWKLTTSAAGFLFSLDFDGALLVNL
jgi:hypothetical protein